MGIRTVPHPPYSPDLVPSDFWLFPKLRGYRYETIEEMKEAVTKVIDTLTQEESHGAFQNLMERYNKYVAAGGDYFEGDWSFTCVLSIKVPIRKNFGNLFTDPHMNPIILLSSFLSLLFIFIQPGFNVCLTENLQYFKTVSYSFIT